MKKAQLKPIMVFCLVAIMLSLVAYAITVTLDSPNNVWSTSSSTDFTWAVKGKLSVFPWCALYTNSTGSWVKHANYTNIANNTNITRGLGLPDSVGKALIWNVLCGNSTDTAWDSGNQTFGIDWHLPTVTMFYPLGGVYLSTNNTNFTFISVDPSNRGSCTLWLNKTGSWALDFTYNSYTSGRTYGYNLSRGSVLDGTYLWNVKCNQTSGDYVWGDSTNRSFTVDMTKPTAFKMLKPINNSYSVDKTPTLGWQTPTEVNFQKYKVYASNDSSSLVSSAKAYVEITNRTENYTTLNLPSVSDLYYFWVTAVDSAGNERNSTAIFYYNLDVGGAPTVTLNYPSDDAYINDRTVSFNVTVVDEDPSYCLLYLSNSTGMDLRLNTTGTSITSGIPYTITSVALRDGNYSWNMGCNDTSGNITNVSSTNLSFVMDKTAPTGVNFTSTWHKKNSTNGNPVLTWTPTNETNFLKYSVSAYNVSDWTLIEQSNITTRTTHSYTFQDLTFDTYYAFNVTSYDQTGNYSKSMNTTAQSLYYLDSTCATLYEGWNICGIVSTSARSLATIGAETSANMVAVWNYSHVFQTCNYQVSPSGTNCNAKVGIFGTNNSAVFIYVNDTKLWQNRTWQALSTSANITLYNSTPAWNVFSMIRRTGRTFRQIDLKFNQTKNVTMYSYFDNELKTSTPHVTYGGFNTINNGTFVDYGEAMWAYFANKTGRMNTTYYIGGW